MRHALSPIARALAVVLPIALPCCSLVNDYQDVPETSGGGMGPGSGGGGGNPECISDQSCDDANACTEDTCPNGFCAYVALEGVECELDGVPGFCAASACVPGCTSDAMCQGLNPDEPCIVGSCNLVINECEFMELDNVLSPVNPDGDCAIASCVVGMTQLMTDDTDVNVDGNECTSDLCNQGVPSNPPVDLGYACNGPGDEQVCDGLGLCVECNVVSDCTLLTPITTPDCESSACTAGTCAYVYAAANTPLNASLQTNGDCQLRVCDGAGSEAASTIDDNSDVPTDGNSCTADSCVSGTPTIVGLPVNTSCGGSLVCSGPPTNNCVGCTINSQCPASTFCLSQACTGGACVATPTANNTVTPSQIAGDCQEQQCNGSGGTKQVSINDPFIDGNPCTSDLCSSGTPSNPPLPIDFSCMGTMFCNGAGTCVQCNSNTQCNGGDNICESDDCVANNCMIVNDPAGTPAPPAQQTAQDCKLAVCAGNGTVSPTPQNDDGDLFNDMIECTADTCSMGTPLNNPKPAGTPCAGGVCDGMTSCVECTVNGDCAANEQCHLATNTCRLSNGEVCALGAECFSANCVDGRCCNTSCSAACFTCNGAVPGTCSGEAVGTEPNNDCATAGHSCSSSQMCACGLDPTPPGGSCPGVCNAGCSATTCNINCGSGMCGTLNCPAGFNCNLTCTGNNGCRDATLNCPANQSCSVDCSNSTDSCRNFNLNCGSEGTCALTCHTDGGGGGGVCINLDVVCGNDACTAACTGSGNPNGFTFDANQSCGASNGC